MTGHKFESMDNLLSGYVCGQLPMPLHVLVDAHLELSPKSRPIVRSMEMEAGEMLRDLEPVAISDRGHRLDAIFASEAPVSLPRTASHCHVFPSALREFVGMGEQDVPWKTVMPGFKEYEMDDVDGFHISLFWIKPGRKMPSHTHEGCEISLILDGAFTDERGRFGRGDISVADDTIDHRPVADTGRPCIGFAVTDGALRLTGPLHQRLGDIIAG